MNRFIKFSERIKHENDKKRQQIAKGQNRTIPKDPYKTYKTVGDSMIDESGFTYWGLIIWMGLPPTLLILLKVLS